MLETVMDEIEIKKYPAYKDAGVEWLGEIPAHWENIRMKHLFQDVSIKKKGEAELLSVTQDQGVVPRTWVENRMVMPSGALDSFKFISKGDFAISLRSFEGGLEYCHHDGIISPAYTVLKAKRKFDSQFFKYLFKSTAFISELQTSVVGIRQGKNISFEELAYSFLPIPSPAEQTAIANFLDRKTALIDQAIGIKEKQIGLLKERRQILIHRAVTRGLNPNAKMKDSGVEWIGEIPERWELIPIRRMVDVRDGTHDTPIYVNDGIGTYPLVTSKDFEGERINFENIKRISERDYINISKRSGVAKGDVLMSMIGGNIGKSVIVEDNYQFAIKNVALFKTSGNLSLAKFIKYYFESGLLQRQIELKSRGGAQGFLSLGDIRNLHFFKIPASELNEIVAFLKVTISEKFDRTTLLKQQEIEKLKEYKASLINSAVTGKIKVI